VYIVYAVIILLYTFVSLLRFALFFFLSLLLLLLFIYIIFNHHLSRLTRRRFYSLVIYSRPTRTVEPFRRVSYAVRARVTLFVLYVYNTRVTGPKRVWNDSSRRQITERFIRIITRTRNADTEVYYIYIFKKKNLFGRVP
jgi:hypothetical protein